MNHKYNYTTSVLQQLTELLAAEIGLLESLDLLIKLEEKAKKRTMLLNIKKQLIQGTKFYQALHSNLKLNLSEIGLIYIGENTGKLIEILQKIITARLKLHTLKTHIWQVSSYPIILFLSCLGLIVFATQYLLPQFLLLINHNNTATLPRLTLVLLNLSKLVASNGIIIIAAFLAVFAIIILLYFNNAAMRLLIDKLIISFPISGPILQLYYHCNFCYLLELNLQAGIAIDKALIDLTHSFSNLYYKIHINALHQHILQGNKINIFFRQTALFPTIMYKMVAIGENSGNLDKMLLNLWQHFDKKLLKKLADLNSLFTPLITTFLGCMIALLVCAIYLPLLELGDFNGLS